MREHNAREQSDTKAGNDTSNDHDCEAIREGLDSASRREDDGADEERALASDEVADASGGKGGD